MTRLARHGAALLGGQLWNWHPLQGGDLAQTLLVYLNDGRRVVVKNGPDPLAEAAMLRTLGETGAPVPDVLAVDEDALVLQYLPADGPLATCWGDLGRVLAQAHTGRPPEGAVRYGWRTDYALGTVAVPNTWMDTWPGFWAERRIGIHLDHVGIDLAHQLERLMYRLPDLLPATPAPSLLHGDLWGGNVLVSARRVTGLIDPCCCYGHAEVDLATAGVFDRPAAAFFMAQESLEAGYEARFAIYRLWIALVHLRLFGATYRPLVAHYLDGAGVG
ncbi:aminoglycoside phosphotransferase [Komagataeibacter medellinensis]|uniref:Aminoglycoside phosphotransferase n=1 Tax=Komagataeibacter medellinensis TaxID=1177712 RepID=A0ABQ6VVH4_9PROT|nr:fructosamine kinase family protein [Komagataeibacter medellinensis]KAB8124194.1 aminoglycoside phosphotransferase [Komagataeibacter medellinensis]